MNGVMCDGMDTRCHIIVERFCHMRNSGPFGVVLAW